MNFAKKVKHPGWVAFFYLSLGLLLYSLGAFILSDGWSRIDSSPQRDFLYYIILYFLPATITVGVIHFLACVLTRQIAVRSAIIAFFSGFFGVFILHLLVKASTDPVAAMAYIAFFIYYCTFAVAGFVVAAIIQGLWRIFSPRLSNADELTRDSQQLKQ